MIFRNFKLGFILTFLFLGLFTIKVEASDEFNITVQDDISTIISEKDTSANVDTINRTITLPKLPLPDIVKFTQQGNLDYAVLTKNGLKQYLFDGSKMVLANSLSIPINDPLSMAVSSDPNGYASFFIAQMNTTNNTFDLKNYSYNGSVMSENPVLNIGGLQTVYSLTNTAKGAAALTDEGMRLFNQTGSGMVELPQMAIPDIQDPLALASSSDGYDIAILKKDKAEYYKFNGISMMSIPALSVTLDPTLKNPKAITIKDNTVSILFEDQLNTYQFNETTQKMEYHAMLSITSGLVKPQAFAFRQDMNDVVIIDEVDSINKKYRAKYFMYDGTQMVEVQALEKDIDNVAIGNRYKQKAEVISNILMIQAEYVDYIRLRAYTETPKGTSITFYVANAGDDLGSANWQETWKVENIDGLSDGIVSKYVSLDSSGNKGYQVYGTPQEAYPSFDAKPNTNDGAITDDQLIVTDNSGNLNIFVLDNQLNDLWTKMPVKDTKIRFKAVLETTDPLVTPMIFAPIGTNNTKGITSSDETAIRLETDAKPNDPIIDPKIDPGNDDPIYPPQEGWIYTTTPTINWSFSDVDALLEPGHTQTASQMLLLAKKDTGSWEIAYNSMKIDAPELGNLTTFKIPTSVQPDIVGPMYQAGSYEFAVFVRTWDSKNVASNFSPGIQFKVLAFERPRVADIVNSPSSIAPKFADPTTHFMILPGMTQDQLATTKAGAQVTFLLDSVGPIMTDPKDVANFYITVDGIDYPVNLGTCESLNTPGNTFPNNRWKLNFWTNAPITTIPDNTLVKAKFNGLGTVGGTTAYYLPPIADGVIKTNGTIYTDWQVTLQGSDRSN